MWCKHCTMEPEQLRVAQNERFTQLLLRLQSHLLNFNSRLSLEPEYKEVNDEWMLQYSNDANNHTVKNSGGFNRSDFLFVVRAYTLVARTGRPAPQARLQHIDQIAFYLKAWSLNHVHSLPQAYQWPSTGHLQFVDITVAEIVVYYLSQQANTLLRKLQEEPMAPLAASLQKQQDIVMGFVTAQRWNETDDEYKKRCDPDYGVYWREAASEQKLLSFVSTASRVLRHIHIHHHLLSCYPHFQLHVSPVTRAMRDHLASWLCDKSQLQLTDGFIRFYRSVSFEMFLPLGARFITSRDPFANREDPLTCLETTLGVETAAYIQSYAEMETTSIASDPSHPMYDKLLLLLFHYMLKQYTSGAFDFVGDDEAPTVLLHYDVDRVAEETALTKRFVILQRRPLLCQLQKLWFMHANGRWMPCKDLQDALLLWMIMVREHYQGMVGNDVDIKGFINAFV